MPLSTHSLLQTFAKERLLELARTFAVALPAGAAKDAHVEHLARSAPLRFRALVTVLTRDDLKAACRAHGLDASGRSRGMLMARLLEAHGVVDSTPPATLFSGSIKARLLPRAGDIVAVRRRQWLVQDVVGVSPEGQGALVSLVCLDDDNQGRPLDVVWDLELGARVLQPEVGGLGAPQQLDPPRHFAAYLHALKWSAVTATDGKLFQAPFRAGIRLLNHQLTPLRKALAMPRANLFIADDVGLGKTIEAGLIAQELILRQRVDVLLIVCPASVCLQWRDEMQKRFGLRFAIMNRAFVARRRQERGFGINPWATQPFLIVSHQLLRRPEYRDPLLHHLGDRVRKSLLILDEAHVAAPAGAQRYAVDSKVTHVIRDLAPRFENRLFLSATPHNGHSNSFSALLEILDPQRFTRGVPVRGREHLETVLVRRLKADLRHLGVEGFPQRKVVRKEVIYNDTTWTETVTGEASVAVVGSGSGAELELAQLLRAYTAVLTEASLHPTAEKPQRNEAARALVLMNLQKRLLSSVEAFARTLEAHIRALGQQGSGRASADGDDDENDEYGCDDDELEERGEASIAVASAELASPDDQARDLLAKMRRLASQHRAAPDGKTLALLHWIRQHQCAAVQVGGAAQGAPRESRQWTDQRIVIFTEYGDTKRYLQRTLHAAFEDTDGSDERILTFHGGMTDEQRQQVQQAFNGAPAHHPVRILIATDAAREGVNLQGHCADLFHFDIPWNPGRMEQRNGRIDRTLQPAAEVRCHYFVYPQRPEDVVLRKVVEKNHTIRHELGSVGDVLLERVEGVLSRGIHDDTAAQIDALEPLSALATTSREELEQSRATLDRLRDDMDEAGEILNRSVKVMNYDPTLLRDALDVGFHLAGGAPLKPLAGDGHRWQMPALPPSWQETLDTLRPARERDESFGEFRRKPPLPVVFDAPSHMNEDVALLHLQHPVVQRVLGRFLAQGFSAHDLSRVTLLRNRHDALVRVIAFGRLSLFGRGATRLHDQLVSVAARWTEGKERNDQPLRPFAEEADRKAIDLLERIFTEAPELPDTSPAVQERVRRAAPELFQALWPHVRDEADSVAHAAGRKLTQRGEDEARALRAILTDQRAAITAEMARRRQLSFADLGLTPREQEQYRKEEQHMSERLRTLDDEARTEPAHIEDLYRVVCPRLEPVGLVVLWPETRA